MSRPLTKKTVSAGAREAYGKEALEEVRRAWGTLILASCNFLSAAGIVLLGGVGVLPRYLLSVAAASIVMSLIFLVKLGWFARGRARGWILLLPGLAVFVLVAKLPSQWIPFKPMSLIDMVQPPLSWNLILVSMLLVLGFFVAVFSLARRR